MSKLKSTGFTDYFGAVIAIVIKSYDNDKYVTVQKPDGELAEIKRGYVYADEALTKPLSRLDWFIHGGGKRKNFKPRFRKTIYRILISDFDESHASSKRAAVALAVAVAKKASDGGVTSVWRIRETVTNSRTSFEQGFIHVNCYEDGTALQFGRGPQGKFLRGHGKMFNYRNHRR